MTARRILHLTAALALAATPLPSLAQDLLKGDGNMESGTPSYIPWAGVGDKDLLSGKVREGLVVNTDGAIRPTKYPGGLAVADLTGDDLPDILMSDSNGFFWLFPNKGTKTTPDWPEGELLSLWMVPVPDDDPKNAWSPTANYPPACTRIYLQDYDGDTKLDIIMGDYLGNVYFIKNEGTSKRPFFQSPNSPTALAKPTGPGGRLWGNYLSPVYKDYNGDYKLDLLVGEGTYSANSVWLFLNEGTNQVPRFNWDARERIIPGMGREHLTPQPVDWNNDGKEDLIVGEREGNVNVYLNETAEGTNDTVFNQEPIVPKFGGSERFTALAAPVPADVNGDGLFDLVATDGNNNILLTLNKGGPGNPEFDAPTKLKGKNPYPAIKEPNRWEMANPLMQSYYTLRLVSNNEDDPLTYEKDFAYPGVDKEGKKNKFVLKYETVKPASRDVQGKPQVPDKLFNRITSKGSVTLEPDTKYVIKFWAKGDNSLSKHRIWLRGGYTYKAGTDNNKQYHVWTPHDYSMSTGWKEVTETFSFKPPKDALNKDDVDNKRMSFSVDFTFHGEGNFYIDDLTITKQD